MTILYLSPYYSINVEIAELYPSVKQDGWTRGLELELSPIVGAQLLKVYILIELGTVWSLRALRPRSAKMQ